MYLVSLACRDVYVEANSLSFTKIKCGSLVMLDLKKRWRCTKKLHGSMPAVYQSDTVSCIVVAFNFRPVLC